MRRVVVLVAVLALVIQPIAVGPVAAESDETIVRTTTLSLTPEEPGTVEAVVSFDVPSSVSSLNTSVPERATVIETVGFERNPDGTYTWERGDDGPVLTMAVSANQTGIGLRDVSRWRAETMESGYKFVDTGPWAIVAAPAMSTEWNYRGDEPGFESRLATDGEGVAGERMAFLGPASTHQRTAHGQTFTLVVPDRADLEEPPAAILDSLEQASGTLQVGERDPRVTVFAAPTTVDWAAMGMAGDADAWVQADNSLDDPNNVWLHEYVHTRTDYRPTEDARWTTEGIAEYYAAQLTLEQGLIGFDAFRDHLDRGNSDRYGSSVLSRPDTWTAGANYLKGALVFGGLDRRLRVETGSRYIAGDVLARMNAREDRVSHAFVVDTVEDLAGSETVAYVDRYVTTEEAPDMWTRQEHSAAFSLLPPRMIVDEDIQYEISGPYRDVTTDTSPILVPNETVTLVATVTNEGDVSGEYDLTFAIDGEPRETITGTLDGGESTTVRVNTTVDSIGKRLLTLGDTSTEIAVESPASPRVTDLSIDEQTISAGESVQVSITAINDADKPARGEIPIKVDGTTVSTWHAFLDRGETVTVTKSVSLEDPGEHEVTVDSHRITVTVEPGTIDAGESSPAVEPETPTNIPGFTVGITVLAIVLAFAFATRRGRH